MLRSLILAAALTLVAPTSAAAQAIDAVQVAAITRSADAFVALARGSAESGAVPRASDPQAGPLLDSIFGVGPLTDAERFGGADLDALHDWLVAIGRVGAVYTLAGTGFETFDGVGRDPITLKRIEANAVTFAPEMGRYFDATVLVEAGMIAAIENLAGRLSADELSRPRVAGALATLRRGVANTMLGDIATMKIAGLSDGWRSERLPALALIAPRAAGFLTAEQAAGVRRAAREVADLVSDPTLRDNLVGLAEALEP